MRNVEEKKELEKGKNRGDDYSVGMAFYRTDMLDKALEKFRRSSENSETADLSLFYIAMIYFRKGEYQKASVRFKKLLEENPEDLAAYNNLAVTLEKLGMEKEAELLYREAEKISPLASQVLANLGVLFYRRGEYTRARENLERAVHLNRGMAFAYFYLGMTCLKLSMWDEADEYLEMSLELSPDNPVIYNNLGIVFKKTGDFRRGLRCSLRALGLDQSLQPAYAKVDDMLCIAGEWDECRKLLDEAVPERDLSARCLDLMGDYYHSRGDYELAHRVWQKSLDTDPENQAIQAKIDKLETP